MLQSKSFFKKTRGGVNHVVREHYLRDDIHSGSPLDAAVPPAEARLAADAARYLIVDANVALHQMDLLEHAVVSDVVVPSTVLAEVKARSAAAHARLRALTAAPARRFFVFANEHCRETYVGAAAAGESANDRNDRAIRAAAAWYTARLAGKGAPVEVVLLSDDAASRRAAVAEGVRALSCAEYAAARAAEAPELADVVAAARSAEAAAGAVAGAGGNGGNGAAGGDARDAKRRRVYPEHLSAAELAAGIRAGRLHQGALRVSRFNSAEGFVGADGAGEDVLIRGRPALNRATDGDVVAVELLPEAEWAAPAAAMPGGGGAVEGEAAGEEEGEEEGAAEGARVAQVDPAEHYDSGGGASSAKRPTGRVVGVIRRAWRPRGYCGSLAPPRAGAPPPADGALVSALFIPVERRLPAVRVATRQAATLADKRIVVAIDAWEASATHPVGHYVRTLGPIGDRDVETEVILAEHDVATAPFSAAVHACVPALPWAVGAAELADPARADFRALPVCSVDPPGCRDIDDALHVTRLPSGNLEVGVHIADVAHFVLPGTAIDAEAAARATTTYLVQRRLDMLPKALTEDICSLRAGVDRLAFSVIWEMAPESAEVLATRFTKSVIRSRAALTYAEAQARLDDARAADDVSVGLKALAALARRLRAARAARGALQLASPEVRFEIDRETHDPLDVGMYTVREANQMVEEFMLLANCAVAEACLRAFPAAALLRRHAPPPPRQLEPLARAAAAAGFALDASSSAALAKSLDAAVREGDPYFNKLVRIMATRCMTQAVYLSSGEAAPEEYHHYGLAAPLYTHFTSPIRRYADVLAHRVLMAALGLRPLPDALRDRAGMRGVVGVLNARHRGAQLAGRASVELHTLIFFAGRRVVADARVTRVRANGLVVFVPKYGIEGPVFFDAAERAAKEAAGVGGGAVEAAAGAGAGAAAGAAADAAAAAQAGAWVYDEEAQSVRSTCRSASYALFDAAAVRISVAEGAGRRRALRLELVPRALLAAEDVVAA